MDKFHLSQKVTIYRDYGYDGQEVHSFGTVIQIAGGNMLVEVEKSNSPFFIKGEHLTFSENGAGTTWSLRHYKVRPMKTLTVLECDSFYETLSKTVADSKSQVFKTITLGLFPITITVKGDDWTFEIEGEEPTKRLVSELSFIGLVVPKGQPMKSMLPITIGGKSHYVVIDDSQLRTLNGY